MSNIQVFDQREVLGKEFKIYGDIDNPLFLAKDVATWIDYDVSSVNKLVDVVDELEKVRKIVPTLGGEQESWFVTEDGLYEILMQSRKPIAKQFKKQVKEILRTIRKHGIYATDSVIEQVLSNPDFGIKLLSELKDERQKRQQLELESAQKSQIINELQPKATYYDMVLQNKSLLSISKIAKDYGMSGTALNALLHELGIQYKQGDVWLLYQKYADKGYTQSKTHVIDDERNKFHTYWTQKGRLFIYDLLKSKKEIYPLIEREGLRLVSSK